MAYYILIPCIPSSECIVLVVNRGQNFFPLLARRPPSAAVYALVWGDTLSRSGVALTTTLWSCQLSFTLIKDSNDLAETEDLKSKLT